jgi:hypothetical protein
MNTFTQKYNFDVDEDDLRDDDWVVWPIQPNDSHAWAFIHFCRRQGHKVYVKGNINQLKLALKRKYLYD